MRARRSFVGLLAASLVLPVAATLAGAAPAAAAEPVVEVGWWTRSPGQSAPEGGFAVAAVPDGPATVAAIRVTSPGLSSVSVVAVETGGLNQGSAAVQACLTTATWAPTAAGELAEAPEADCEAGSVGLVRDAAGMRWAADLTPLVRDGVLSVVLVPGDVSGAGMIGFDVRFATPQIAAAGDPEPPSAEPTTAGGTTSDGTATGSTGSGTSGSGGGTGSFGGGATSFTPPSTSASATPSSGFGSSVGSSFTASPPPPAPVPAGSAPQPLAESSGEEVALAPTAVGEESAAFTPLSGEGEPAEPRWGQALFFVVISAVAAIATAGGNRFRRQRAAAT